MTLQLTCPSGQWNPQPIPGGETTWTVTGNNGAKVTWTVQNVDDTRGALFTWTASGSANQTITISNNLNSLTGLANVTATANGQSVTASVYTGTMIAYGPDGTTYAAPSDAWTSTDAPGWLPSQDKMAGTGLVWANEGHPSFTLNQQGIPNPNGAQSLYAVRTDKGTSTDNTPPEIYVYPPSGAKPPTGNIFYFPANKWQRVDATMLADTVPTFSQMQTAQAGLGWGPDPDGSSPARIVPNVACYVLNLDNIQHQNGPTYMTVTKKS